MTSELEKNFFDAFGIEPQQEITDRILLELLCIANRVSTTISETIDELKEETLQTLIEMQEILSDEECLFPMAYWARKKKEKEKEETYTQVRAVFGLESEEK